MTKPNAFQNIRPLLHNSLSDEDLRRLCYDEPAFKSFYARLSPEMGKARLVNQLVDFAAKKSALHILQTWIETRKPAPDHRPKLPSATITPEGHPGSEPASAPSGINVNLGGGNTGPIIIGEGNQAIINSEQAVMGQENIVSYGSAQAERVDAYQDRAKLAQMLDRLKSKIETEAPLETKEAALEHLASLEETFGDEEPDLYTLVGVNRWFHRRLPFLADDVIDLLTHPIVKRLIAATQDPDLMTAYRRRFGRNP